MAKVKIFELKNQINNQIDGVIESKDIQDYLEKSMGVKKTHSSNLEDDEVSAIKRHFMPVKKAPEAPVRKAAQPQTQSRPAQPGLGMQSVRPAGDTGVKSASQAGAVRQGQGQGAARPASAQGNQAQQGLGAVRNANPMRSGDAQRSDMSRSSAGPRPDGQRTAGSQGMSRPAGQGYQGSQSQYSGHNQQGSNMQRSGDTLHGTSGQRMAGGQSGMRPGTQGTQASHGYNQPSGQTQRSGMPQQSSHPQQGSYNQAPRNDAQRSGGTYRSSDAQRSNDTFRNNSGARPADGSQRPLGQGNMRQPGQGYQGGQSQHSSQQGMRSDAPRNNDAYRGNAGQRPTGEYNRPMGEGGQRPYNNNSGQGGMRQGSQTQSYHNQRPYGDGQNTGRQGGQGQQGYSGQRPYGQGTRPAGSDSGYTRNQGGQRPYNNNSGQGGSYNQNRRPYSQDGTRPQGQGRPDGQRPYNNNSGQGGYQRPQGSGPRPQGGFGPRNYDNNFQKDKDEDDKPSYGNRNQKRSPGGRGGNERKNFDQQILDQKVAEKNDYNNKRNRDRINKDKLYKDKGIINESENDEEVNISKIAPRKGQFIQPKPVVIEDKADEIKTITLPEVLTIKELAEKMKLPSSALVKKLFLAGKIVTINQEITYEEAEEIALDYDIIAEKEVKVNEVEELLKEAEEDTTKLVKRPPVVCVMGHVDHGKTSLLDAIRETNVTAREAGGITQHIGAYVVEINGEKITFLDTPGHEAFTSMRMRGAQATDIAILVVAADDGVMPQTVEAISHAKAAGVQIIVAINKIDKPSANIERVKQELTEYNLIAEDWGGDTIFAPVSAHTKEGIDHLLEMILLTAEMAELKANPDRNARGLVIEAELDKGRGPVATILVQKGTLHVGDNIVIGASFGKVRAMMDDKGRRVKEATPSTPVEILGLNEVPGVGEIFVATESEKEARTIAEAYISQGKEKLIADTKAKLSLDGLFSQIQAGNIKEFNLIIKADVQGSVEAMKQSLLKLSNDEVAVRIIHGGVGAINESDVILASTSNAIIIGFNVKPDNAAKETADREKIDIKLYRVIYNAIDDVEAAMKGMLDPVFAEQIIGHAEIRQTFKASGVGTIAGSYVLDGKIVRGSKARIYRDNSMIFEGVLASLKRFQDDVKEVAAGYECGLVFEKFNDVKEGDKVELYIMTEVPR